MTDKPRINIVVSEDLPERYRRLVTIDDNSGVIGWLPMFRNHPTPLKIALAQAASGRTWAVWNQRARCDLSSRWKWRSIHWKLRMNEKSMSESTIFAKHKKLTELRSRAYEELFGDKPTTVFPQHALFGKPDERFLIDIFVYKMTTEAREIQVAVTNGMSDQRMIDPGYPPDWHRREIIQYFPICTEGHARRMHDMAWLPLFDEFYLDTHHSIAWEHPAIPETPWKNAFFLLSPVKSHRDFFFEAEGDKVSFLWHIPISDQERRFKQEHGTDDLIDRMDAVNLPWVFDENNRPAMVD